MTRLTRTEQLANMAKAREDAVFFVTEVIGAKPFNYQIDILKAISDPAINRIVWHTAHGVGKTTTMSWITAWFLFTRANSKVITTASVNRQVREVLWPEIHRWMNKAKPNLELIGWKWPFTLLDMKLEISQEWFALGASSDTPENMEGFHADHLLYIVDEAKTVEKGIFEAVEGALTGNIEAKLIVVSTPPMAREGHFYELCTGKFPGYKIFHTKAEDSPNVSKEWIEQKKLEWGETSPVFISKVMGDFPDSSENTLIPTSWVEYSQQRWKEMTSPVDSEVTLGVDPARYGDDESIIAIAKGVYILPLEAHNKQDTMQTAGHVIRAITRYNGSQVNIDTVGLGAGVYDRVREELFNQKIPCSPKPVHAGGKAPSIVVRGERLKFKRYRDYLYWNFREQLDPINCPMDELVALPPDDRLKQQLTSIRYKINPDGSIEVESKDELKKRGYNSPDRAEAVMMAKAKGYEGWATTIR